MNYARFFYKFPEHVPGAQDSVSVTLHFSTFKAQAQYLKSVCHLQPSLHNIIQNRQWLKWKC